MQDYGVDFKSILSSCHDFIHFCMVCDEEWYPSADGIRTYDHNFH